MCILLISKTKLYNLHRFRYILKFCNVLLEKSRGFKVCPLDNWRCLFTFQVCLIQLSVKFCCIVTAALYRVDHVNILNSTLYKAAITR